MSILERILAGAERIFDARGFHGTSADRLIEAAGVSSRTLYKHTGSKDGLARMVLRRREERFFASMSGDSITELFDSLAAWITAENARGCLFLRANGEYADHAEFRDIVLAHKTAFTQEIARRVEHDLGKRNAPLTDQILILFEGAVATAVYRGLDAVTTAKRTAIALLRQARENS